MTEKNVVAEDSFIFLCVYLDFTSFDFINDWFFNKHLIVFTGNMFYVQNLVALARIL